jgi:hypothetical protein
LLWGRGRRSTHHTTPLGVQLESENQIARKITQLVVRGGRGEQLPGYPDILSKEYMLQVQGAFNELVQRVVSTRNLESSFLASPRRQDSCDRLRSAPGGSHTLVHTCGWAVRWAHVLLRRCVWCMMRCLVVCCVAVAATVIILTRPRASDTHQRRKRYQDPLRCRPSRFAPNRSCWRHGRAVRCLVVTVAGMPCHCHIVAHSGALAFGCSQCARPRP